MAESILPPKILLIENDPAGADRIRAALAETGNGSFDVEWVRQLSEGLARLSKGGIDAVLLELSLPDSHGIETFDKLFTAAPDVPILILGNGNRSPGERGGGARRAGLSPGRVTSIAIRCRARCATRSSARPSRMRCTAKKNARWSPSTRLVTPFSAPTFPGISPISISLQRP